LHYPAIDNKNKKFYLHFLPAVTDFRNGKNSPFSHKTRKFVQSIEGVRFCIFEFRFNLFSLCPLWQVFCFLNLCSSVANNGNSQTLRQLFFFDLDNDTQPADPDVQTKAKPARQMAGRTARR